MKKHIQICAVLLCVLLCTACGDNTAAPQTTDAVTTAEHTQATDETTIAVPDVTSEPTDAQSEVTTTEATTEATTKATTALNVLQYTPLGEKEIKNRMTQAKKDGTLCVVIDPGHGLVDPGAVHDENLGDVTESDITLAIANKLAAVLEDRGYTVVLTHDGETKPYTEYDDGKAVYGPSERCGFSNAQDAHLFISLHCDAYPQSEDVSGTRIYYPVDTPNSTKYDKEIASACKKALEKAFPDAKKVSLMDMHGEDCYTVIYKTVVPSILVECGFITNKDDAAKLLDETWQQSFADALANGVDSFFN